MKLHILSLKEALAFEPTEESFVIRIRSSATQEYPSLKESPHFKRVHEYIFDDTYPNDRTHRTHGVLFNAAHAEQIVSDFESGRNGCSSLIVHCKDGMNRSPAIAIALDEAYSLGNSPAELKALFTLYNPHIYKTMKNIAEKKRTGVASL